jgi:hypothetical protein
MPGTVAQTVRLSFQRLLVYGDGACEDATVQTLGITDRQQEPDNIFRRIFWPSNHAADVDALGQQGFWVCLAAAILSLVQLAFQGHWVLAVSYALFYFFGGMGVREHSRTAAIIVATFFLFNLVGSAVVLGMPPGFVPLGILCLLLANIRGTWIASRWQNVGDAFPDRLQETWRDRLVDVLPARTWPAGKYFFFLIGIGLFVLSGLGIFRMSTLRPKGQVPTEKIIELKASPAPNQP